MDVLLPYVKYTPWTFSSEDTLCCFSFSFPSYPGYSEALSSPSSSLLPTLPLPSLSHTIRLQRNLRGHSQRFQLRPSLYPLPSLTLLHFTSVDRFTHPLPLLSYIYPLGTGTLSLHLSPSFRVALVSQESNCLMRVRDRKHPFQSARREEESIMKGQERRLRVVSNARRVKKQKREQKRVQMGYVREEQ